MVAALWAWLAGGLHLAAALSCLTSPCLYGICLDAPNGSYTCYCIDGFTGAHCQTNWDECWSSPCLHGGTCVDGVARFQCLCQEGFLGETCEENVDECISNPCLNNGTCVDVANGYHCQCFPGYTGVNCETDMAVCNTTEDGHCSNGGTCLEGPGASFSCRCLPGWSGLLCEKPTNECESAPCENGGVCIDMHATYICACPYGYTGKNCETRVQLCGDNICENKALCVVENKESVCYCVPDYHGERCQFKYDECQKGPGCLNGGTCIDGVDSYSCSCPVGLHGRFCECISTASGDLNCNYLRFPTPTPNTRLPEYTPTTSYWTTPELSSISTQFSLSTGKQTYVPINFSIPDSSTIIHTTGITFTTEEGSSSPELTSLSYTTDMTTLSETLRTDVTLVTIDLITEISKQTGSEWDTTPVSLPTESLETTTVETDVVSGATSQPPLEPPHTTQFSPGTHTATSEGLQGTTITDIDLVETRELPSEKYTDLPITSSPPLSSTEYTAPLEESSPSPDTRSSTQQPSSEPASRSEAPITFSSHVYTESTTPEETTCGQYTCANGGTCYEDKAGVKCQCAFGWSGRFCEVEEGIKVAAFRGNSYLLHILGNGTRATISFRLRSLADKGLLVFAHVTSNMYMSLYIHHGLLKFQFSCGVQTMLFSELKYPINTGFEMDISATLELLDEGEEQKCAGTVKLNGTLSMTGKQEASVPKFGNKATGAFYIGGLPRHIANQVELPVRSGITACIHSLMVNGVGRFIYSDAVDGEEVSECTSLACLSSPCSNAATCLEEDHRHHCLCPSGFTGKTCRRSVCLNNPCKYGGTCVTYPGSGFLCLCPLGKHGMYCEEDLDVGHPHFSSSVDGLSSYTAYPLPGAIHHSFELKFRFIPSTLDQIALMVFVGQGHPHDTTSDHLAVSFIKGYVVLTWNLGSGPRRIFTPDPIAGAGLGKEIHTVRLGRSGQEGWLQVDGMPNVTGTSPGYLSQLNARPIIYIGGYETQNFSGLPHDLPLHSGFSGCLFEVELGAGRVRLALQRSRDAVGRNVGQCSTRHCHNSTCLHAGVCIDHGATFTCLCQDGWFGPTCGLKYNPCDNIRHNCSEGSICVPLEFGYECDCPFGKTGKFCENEEVLSDIGFSGLRSYLSLAPASLDLAETCIDLEVRPVSSNGLLLYSSQAQALSTTFISLSLHGGVLELRLLPLGGQRSGDIMVVRSGRVLPLGEWTRIRAGRYGRRIFLWVDGTVNAGTLLPGEILLPSQSPLYIGGVPDLSELPAEAVTWPPVPLVGCVRRVWVNWRAVPLDQEHVIAGRNLHDCDGTACGGDVCLNAGSCFLTPDNKPTCKCLQQFMGERCEKQASCEEVGCENSGRCVKEDSSFRCQCPAGWTGPFCSIEVPLGTPHFAGDSYLEVDTRRGLAKRGGGPVLPSQPVLYLFLNFSTAHHDGVILWASQEEGFLGLGLEKGLGKVVWGRRAGDGRAVLLPGSLLSDGTWHTLTLQLSNGQILLSTDKSVTHSYSTSLRTITQGTLYLGGFPQEKQVYAETLGHFQSQFSGCLKELAWNKHFSVVDFSRYKGENLGSCDLFYSPKDLRP